MGGNRPGDDEFDAIFKYGYLRCVARRLAALLRNLARRSALSLARLRTQARHLQPTAFMKAST